MLIVFFDCHWIVHHEFVPEGQTVNAAFCVEVLKRLRYRVCCVRPRGQRLDPSAGQCPLAHCLDCAWVVGAQFNHCDGPSTLLARFSSLQFFLVSKVQVRAAWAAPWGDVATITAELTTLLKGLKEDDFQECFNRWKRRRDKCVASEGDKMMYPIIRKIQILWT
jgi:hypothetical protein